MDSIETEKSRVILQELEPDWWILAVRTSIELLGAFLICLIQSVNLTRLPSPSESTATHSQRSVPPMEYSAREVCPPHLLLPQIIRAHQIFLLHQSPSIAELYARVPRPKFCGLLKRFWDGFIRDWEVLLHGNPAVDIFNGLKLAAGGELGMGEGEEEWGSGEREVLEGFIGRTTGLVDLLVSRFGDTSSSSQASSRSPSLRSDLADVRPAWQVSGLPPRPSDGVVFSGVGALTRSSVKSISSWTEWLYMYGKEAYGVRENPASLPRRRRPKVEPPSLETASLEEPFRQRRGNSTRSRANTSEGTAQSPNNAADGIPPPIVGPGLIRQSAPEPRKDGREVAVETRVNSTETLMKYLTLGVYGSSWGIPYGRPPVNQRVSSLRREIGSKRSGSSGSSNMMTPEPEAPPGYFLIGLQGQLEEDVQVLPNEEDIEEGTDQENAPEDRRDLNHRIIMRTLHVERGKESMDDSGNGVVEGGKAMEELYHDRLRVVVYVQPPFIFTFLFELQTDTLAMPSFYRSLHHQLGPLQRPLATCTSPEKVSARLWEAAAPKSTASTENSQPIWDLVYDPVRLTVHTTLPNIPEPALSTDTSSTSDAQPWTRIEALSVHSQVLKTYISTRRHTSELETTCKTSRGWWVVWMRLPHGAVTKSSDARNFREAFLIRKASDYVAPTARKSGGRFGRDAGGSSATVGWGPGKLAEGIGIDARQYIEGILSLNR